MPAKPAPLAVDWIPDGTTAGPLPSLESRGPARGESRATEEGAINPVSGDDLSSPSPQAGIRLAESAMHMAAHLARNAMPHTLAKESSSAKPAAIPAEFRYADGRTRVTSPDGRIYCTREPAEFVYPTGGLLPRLAIATNCP